MTPRVYPGSRPSRAAMVRAAGAPTWWRRVRPGLSTSRLSPQLAPIVGRLTDAVAAVIDTGESVHLGGELGHGEPVGRRRQGGASRIRGLLRSTPPTRVAPSRTPVGSSSKMCSPRNPVSTRSGQTKVSRSRTRSEDCLRVRRGRCAVPNTV